MASGALRGADEAQPPDKSSLATRHFYYHVSGHANYSARDSSRCCATIGRDKPGVPRTEQLETPVSSPPRGGHPPFVPPSWWQTLSARVIALVRGCTSPGTTAPLPPVEGQATVPCDPPGGGPCTRAHKSSGWRSGMGSRGWQRGDDLRSSNPPGLAPIPSVGASGLSPLNSLRSRLESRHESRLEGRVSAQGTISQRPSHRGAARRGLASPAANAVATRLATAHSNLRGTLPSGDKQFQQRAALAFEAADRRRQGVLTEEEAASALVAILGKPTPAQIRALVETGGERGVSKAAFTAFVHSTFAQMNPWRRAAHIFRLHDANNDGLVDYEDAAAALLEIAGSDLDEAGAAAFVAARAATTPGWHGAITVKVFSFIVADYMKARGNSGLRSASGLRSTPTGAASGTRWGQSVSAAPL